MISCTVSSIFVEFSIDVHDFMNKVNQSSDKEMKNLWKNKMIDQRIVKEYFNSNTKKDKISRNKAKSTT